jgi:hypothetical protein
MAVARSRVDYEAAGRTREAETRSRWWWKICEPASQAAGEQCRRAAGVNARVYACVNADVDGEDGDAENEGLAAGAVPG